MKITIGLCFSLALLGQQQYNSDIVNQGKVDSSGATHTLPAKVGIISSKPATCTVGEMYFATDATAGANWYYCTATNTWTAQSSSGGGVGTLLLAWGASSGLASGTNYLQVNGLVTAAAAIANRETVIPAACTAQNAYLTTGSTQGSGGTLVFTLYKDVAGTPTATALQVTVGANTAAGQFSDVTHQVSLSAGDNIAWQVANNHSSTSAAVRGLSFQCK